MNHTPLVSIVTPFLNAERFLAETVDSVLNQSYPNWELLLVDDGSQDGGTETALRYARDHPHRIRYLEHLDHANRGKSVSRNLGIEHARGEYLAFLDADDVFLPHKLAHQTPLIDADPELVMVYGPTRYWYSWTGHARDRQHDRIQSLGHSRQTRLRPPHTLTRYLTRPGSVPCTCALLVRRAAAVSVGGFDISIQDLYEDQVFLAKLSLHGAVLIDTECCDQYRQHSESTSYTAIDTGEYHPYLPNPSRLAFLDWLGNYLDELQINDSRLRRAYRAAYRPYRFPRLSRMLAPIHYATPWIRAWTDHLTERLVSRRR